MSRKIPIIHTVAALEISSQAWHNFAKCYQGMH